MHVAWDAGWFCSRLLRKNVARGLTFGSYSTLVVAIERRMHVDRGLSTAGIAVSILTTGLVSPFAGMLIRRLGIRTVLIIGVLLCGSGYLVAALSASIWVLLEAIATDAL